jgi:hypothetical protein
MYYYFNAKYAREGFHLNGQPASLTDDTDRGRLSEWVTFVKYANVLQDQNSFISECKMMRGSCKRIWRTLSKEDGDEEYILKILYAFSTYGLNNQFYFEEAENHLLDGMEIYYRKNKDYSLLMARLSEFEKLLISCTNEKDYIPYLNLAKHKIMLRVNRLFASSIISNYQNTI